MQTFGWDTVFIVSADRINGLLAANSASTPLAFEVALPNLPAQVARGTFLPWQLADGGSNEIVHLRLTIASGTLATGTAIYDLSGLALVVATYLKWLELGVGEESLRFGYERLGETGNEPKRGELSVIALYDPDEVLPPDLNALLAFALGGFLVANADQARFVFATVNLIPPETDSWLTPKKSSYGYFRREDSKAAYLAVLSVTTDREIAHLQRTVDPAAFPGTGNASFVISAELFLTSIIAPSLGKALRADGSAFDYDSRAGVLRNNRRLWTPTVRSGLIDYAPWIDALEVRSAEHVLLASYKGGVDLKARISMTYTISCSNPAIYNAGSGTLDFAADPSPRESHNAHVPWYWFFAGPLVIGIVEIVVKVISDDIAGQVSKDNRERLALGRYPPSSILWGGTDAIKVTSMALDGALGLVGNV